MFCLGVQGDHIFIVDVNGKGGFRDQTPFVLLIKAQTGFGITGEGKGYNDDSILTAPTASI